VCHADTFTDIGVEMNVYHIEGADEKLCVSDSAAQSTCTTNYDPNYAYNEKYLVFESTTKRPVHISENWKLWAGIAGGVFVLLLLLILLYKLVHKSHVTKMKNGLPPSEVAKAQRKINAHEFANIH
jgi:hypothetical protein